MVNAGIRIQPENFLFYNTPSGCLKTHLGKSCNASHDATYQGEIDGIIKAQCVNPPAIQMYRQLKEVEREKIDTTMLGTPPAW